jgi:putative ABC transport system permease protein
MKLLLAVAWRNLWRSPRRTWLSAAGIAFAIMLLVFSMSIQTGSYSTMIDGATRLMTGHIQVQRVGYLDNPRLRDTIPHANALRERVARMDGVAGTALRSSAFALAAVSERSFGALIVGVEPERERVVSTLPRFVREGRYLDADGTREAVVGAGLARNLGAEVGSEIVLLGSAKEGGVAALVLEVVGIIDTGQAELDRTLAHVTLGEFNAAFGLEDEANVIVVDTDDVGRSPALARRIADALGDETLAVVAWNQLVPEIEQAIEVDRVSGYFFYVLLAAIVLFSIVNTFIMIVFERTREFGTLMSLGTGPGFILLLLQLESLCLALLGVLMGLGLGAAITAYTGEVGIYLGETVGEAMRSIHMPERLHPRLNLTAVWMTPLLMLIATQLAALFPALRIRRLNPVEARRNE